MSGETINDLGELVKDVLIVSGLCIGGLSTLRSSIYIGPLFQEARRYYQNLSLEEQRKLPEPSRIKMYGEWYHLFFHYFFSNNQKFNGLYEKTTVYQYEKILPVIIHPDNGRVISKRDLHVDK